MKYNNIREEELKNRVGQDYFQEFNSTRIIGNIDFCVSLMGKSEESLLWAEAKKGVSDMEKSIVQLVLTIGKARTFDKYLPPPFLAAFDAEKIAFVPYQKVQHLFFKNDFNWNVTPSSHQTKEFQEIKSLIQAALNALSYKYEFGRDDEELKFFIKNNIAKATERGKIQIDKNNFVSIYLRWLDVIKPLINFDFDEGKKQHILDSDFYLADLFVDDQNTDTTEDDTPIKDDLFVIYQHGRYEIAKKDLHSLFNAFINLSDKTPYEQFWKKYKRPPIEEFQDYIVERKDLLVPQDIRERKGAYFTPKQWVELSQRYIKDVLGEDWQEEYYVWDCAAGTGNLLAGLTNKHNVYASTLDQSDVNVMRDRIRNGANLLESHVFQFDFLNDDFSKLPQSLQDIINDEQKRKKLVIYINPPYAEATSAKTVFGSGQNKTGVSTNYQIKGYFNKKIGNASNELFALFMAQVYEKVPHSKLAIFSTLKFIQGTNFKKFKTFFLADYLKGFIAPASTFDNVKGNFPIGFTIWDLSSNNPIKRIKCNIFDANAKRIGKKVFFGNLPESINKWFINFQSVPENRIGILTNYPPDFQNQTKIFIKVLPSARSGAININASNIIPLSIYFSVRHCILATWLNDRDQFLYPKDDWQSDTAFQNDCLAFALFHGQNRISSKDGTNHWIPFSEQEVDAKERFKSHFMKKFIQGTLSDESNGNVLEKPKLRKTPLTFSKEASAVFDAGRALWKYYHAQPHANENASLYDIRAYFQGRNGNGKMKHSSDDTKYTELVSDLREKLKALAKKIEPKVYEYGFLK